MSREIIIECLKKEKRWLAPKHISQITGLSQGSISKSLISIRKMDEVEMREKRSYCGPPYLEYRYKGDDNVKKT